jgi:hypothetical protein
MVRHGIKKSCGDITRPALYETHSIARHSEYKEVYRKTKETKQLKPDQENATHILNAPP